MLTHLISAGRLERLNLATGSTRVRRGASSVGGCDAERKGWSCGMSKVFTKSFEICWDDVDANGHLRSTRYLQYAVSARLGFLREAGWSPRVVTGQVSPPFRSATRAAVCARCSRPKWSPWRPASPG